VPPLSQKGKSGKKKGRKDGGKGTDVIKGRTGMGPQEEPLSLEYKEGGGRTGSTESKKVE